MILSAIAPLPENVPELMLASLIAGHRLPTCGGPGPHPLIANAEFALIGKVPPQTRRAEGPFGDHYGYYSLTHDYPVFQVERLTHRRDAIYPATVVGKPRQEDFYIGDLFTPMFACYSITAALRERDRTGKGEYLDVSMMDTLTSVLMMENLEEDVESGVPMRVSKSG